MATEMQMGKCWYDGCYEYAEIMLTGGIIDKWMDEGEEVPHTLLHTAAGWYLYLPKPAPEDIVGSKIEARGGWFVLTLKIRRGKEMLAEWLNMHSAPSFTRFDWGVGLFCASCEKTLDVPWDSFGYLGGQLAKQALKGSDPQACFSEGALRRDVGPSDPGSATERSH